MMIKSFNGITSLFMAMGLVGSNFYALNIASNKDSIPNIAHLPNTDFSSFSIRSDKTKDGHSWAIAQNQHSPKTLLEYRDIKEEKPTFSGKLKKSDSYIHRETVAYAYRPIVQEGSEGLTAQEQRCLELGLTGKANGKIIGSGVGAATAPAISHIPIIGPVFAGLFFSEATRTAGNLGSDVSQQWNDC
tara:strand:+ start:3340 stop:3903 length:564 start_codon:yes stop_codon:yes gene_type:complete